jgi:hypothetical protein
MSGLEKPQRTSDTDTLATSGKMKQWQYSKSRRSGYWARIPHKICLRDQLKIYLLLPYDHLHYDLVLSPILQCRQPTNRCLKIEVGWLGTALDISKHHLLVANVIISRLLELSFCKRILLDARTHNPMVGVLLMRVLNFPAE